MQVTESFVKNTRPVLVEGGFAIILGLIFVSSITTTDIAFHGDYVLLIQSWCYPENQDDFCTDFRERHGLDITDQDGIGSKYWDRLAGQAIELFAGLFAVRMVFAYMLQLGARKKIRITSILIALVWGLSATTLFMTGMLDTLYYVFQEEPVPDKLPWLDNAGLFKETKSWFGDPNTVDINDLIATNMLGISILIGITLFTALIFNENGLKHRGIA